MKLLPSVPNLAADMLTAVLDGILISLAFQAQNAVVLETGFEVKDEKAKGHFFLLPDAEGLDQILKALKV